MKRLLIFQLLFTLHASPVFAWGSASMGGGAGLTCSWGSNVVVNGTFTGNANNWTLGAGWAYTANTVQSTGDGTLSQTVSVSASQIWRISYDIPTYLAGTVTVSIGGTNGTARSSSGTHTEDITASGAGNLIFTPAVGANFTLDNVTARLWTCE